MADPTHAEKMITAIEAVLEGRVTADVENYTIDGRHITKIPVVELVVLRDKYRKEVLSEQAAASVTADLGNPRKVHTRFMD